MYIKRNTGAQYYTTCMYVCVCLCVALGIQHAMRISHILLSSVACPPLQYFSKLSHKRQDFRRKVTENKMF
jgi:1,4-dihydroxy-2-naphthoate octaprenyltransferase